MAKIYLDDVRTPVDKSWAVVRNYDQFVITVMYGWVYVKYLTTKLK